MENIHTDVWVLRVDTLKNDPYIIRVCWLYPLTLDKTGQFLFLNMCEPNISDSIFLDEKKNLVV